MNATETLPTYDFTETMVTEDDVISFGRGVTHSGGGLMLESYFSTFDKPPTLLAMTANGLVLATRVGQ